MFKVKCKIWPYASDGTMRTDDDESAKFTGPRLLDMTFFVLYLLSIELSAFVFR